jgi:PAS domain S-box-containing protein
MELKPLNVLIVDDSEDDALLIARRIRKAGYDVRFRRVETAEGMIDALGSDSWHAVIADVNLPCFSADAALDVYHRVQCDLAFIVVSGAVSEETAVSLLKAGAHDFVLKSNLARLVPALERERRDAEMRTAKRAAEEALRVSEERYALAARGVNDGLWDWSIREDHVHYSARWKAMLGCTEDEIGPGIHEWFDRIHPEDVDLLYQALAEHLDGKAPGFACEHRVRHADGDWRWMLARGLAVRDSVGTPTRMAGSLTDVTARKSTELELRRVNEQLENAMSARMRFLAAASHDLRQPVQSLFFFTEALNRHVPPGQGRDYLGLLERGLDTLKALLDRLLDVSRLDMGLILRWTPLVRQSGWRVKRESRGIIAPCRCWSSVRARGES